MPGYPCCCDDPAVSCADATILPGYSYLDADATAFDVRLYSTITPPPGCVIVSETWDFGDGSAAEVGSIVTHTYTRSGSPWVATLTVVFDCDDLTCPVAVQVFQPAGSTSCNVQLDKIPTTAQIIWSGFGGTHTVSEPLYLNTPNCQDASHVCDLITGVRDHADGLIVGATNWVYQQVDVPVCADVQINSFGVRHDQETTLRFEAGIYCRNLNNDPTLPVFKTINVEVQAVESVQWEESLQSGWFPVDHDFVGQTIPLVWTGGTRPCSTSGGATFVGGNVPKL